MSAVFVPGWGAPASLYSPLLPQGWTALEPPSFASSGGVLDAYRSWLGGELSVRGRSVVGGHSMGAALALLVAAGAPELVERLVLVAPAGLPLQKPMHQSVAAFVRQIGGGLYPRAAAVKGIAAVARAPWAALGLARTVRALDLRAECARIREAGVPATVVGCPTDTLVRSDHARRLAHALGARYVEVDVPGGHMWMLGATAAFGAAIASA